MDIALDKVCGLIVRAREIDVKEGITDPASGSNPIDDGWTDVLTSAPGDATEAEVRDMIAGRMSRARRADRRNYEPGSQGRRYCVSPVRMTISRSVPDSGNRTSPGRPRIWRTFAPLADIG